MAKAAVPKLGDFKPQALSNTAWAYATAGHAAPSLFDAVAKAAVPNFAAATPTKNIQAVQATVVARASAPSTTSTIMALAMASRGGDLPCAFVEWRWQREQ